MKFYKIAYIAVGVILLAACILTADKGLSQEDRQVYEQANRMQEEMQEHGFRNFILSEYKVRFFDGDYDYVMNGTEVIREDPVFQTFVGTAYEVEGEYQIVMPTLERFSQMFSILGAAGGLSQGSTSFETAAYGMEEHIATLWHEGFHAYQFTHYEENVLKLAVGLEGEGNPVLTAIDGDTAAVSLFEEGMGLLRTAYYEEDTELKIEILLHYLDKQQERAKLLAQSNTEMDLTAAERYYETIEGTARYMESLAYELQKGTGQTEVYYLGAFTYENGTDKYYSLGMLKCRILSQLTEGWEERFDFSQGIDEFFGETIFMGQLADYDI